MAIGKIKYIRFVNQWNKNTQKKLWGIQSLIICGKRRNGCTWVTANDFEPCHSNSSALSHKISSVELTGDWVYVTYVPTTSISECLLSP